MGRQLLSKRAIPGWLLLAAGTAWKVIQAASNIHFMWSLKDFVPPEAPIRALAVFLSEWGWLLLIPAGFVWLYWAVNTPRVEPPSERHRLEPQQVVDHPDWTDAQRKYAGIMPSLPKEQREILYDLYRGPRDLYITNYNVEPLLNGGFIVVLYSTMGQRAMCELHPDVVPVVKAWHDEYGA